MVRPKLRELRDSGICVGSLDKISHAASGALNWLVPVPLKRALVTCAPGCAVICCSYLRPKLNLIVFESGLRLVKQKQDQ